MSTVSAPHHNPELFFTIRLFNKLKYSSLPCAAPRSDTRRLVPVCTLSFVKVRTRARVIILLYVRIVYPYSYVQAAQTPDNITMHMYYTHAFSMRFVSSARFYTTRSRKNVYVRTAFSATQHIEKDKKHVCAVLWEKSD